MSAILSTNASGSFILFVFRQNQRMTLALATHLFISPQNQPLLPVIGGGIFKTNQISASSIAKKKHALCWRQLIYEVYFHCVHCTNTLHYTDKLKKRKEIMMNYKWMAYNPVATQSMSLHQYCIIRQFARLYIITVVHCSYSVDIKIPIYNV